MDGYSFRDPAIKHDEAYRVWFKGQIMPPTFNSKGAADAYLAILRRRSEDTNR